MSDFQVVSSASAAIVQPCTSSTTEVYTSSTCATTQGSISSTRATGPVPPTFNKSDFQSPTIAELKATGSYYWYCIFEGVSETIFIGLLSLFFLVIIITIVIIKVPSL